MLRKVQIQVQLLIHCELGALSEERADTSAQPAGLQPTDDIRIDGNIQNESWSTT